LEYSRKFTRQCIGIWFVWNAHYFERRGVSTTLAGALTFPQRISGAMLLTACGLLAHGDPAIGGPHLLTIVAENRWTPFAFRTR
jgi:hypothetical protein